MSDTVGFVRDLPHELVEAFRSTLEEATDADLLVHLVDASDTDPDHQVRSVRAVLDEIGANSVRELIVFNKIDAVDAPTSRRLRSLHPDAQFISAATGEGIDDLLEAVVDALKAGTVELQLLIPYERGDVLAEVHASGDVLDIVHTENGTEVATRMPHATAARFRRASASSCRASSCRASSSRARRSSAQPVSPTRASMSRIRCSPRS